MAQKHAASADSQTPQLCVRDWLIQHPEHAVESAAGFVVHVGRDAWDTAEHWADRWAAWLIHPHKEGG